MCVRARVCVCVCVCVHWENAKQLNDDSSLCHLKQNTTPCSTIKQCFVY